MEDLTFLLQALGEPDFRSFKQQPTTSANYNKTAIYTDENQSEIPTDQTQNLFKSRDFH